MHCEEDEIFIIGKYNYEFQLDKMSKLDLRYQNKWIINDQFKCFMSYRFPNFFTYDIVEFWLNAKNKINSKKSVQAIVDVIHLRDSKLCSDFLKKKKRKNEQTNSRGRREFMTLWL